MGYNWLTAAWYSAITLQPYLYMLYVLVDEQVIDFAMQYSNRQGQPSLKGGGGGGGGVGV